MIISNVEIAKVVKKKGYDFEKTLYDLDAMRTTDEEEKPINIEYVIEIIENICLSFEIEKEENQNI